jgi:hypothetical protein
MRLTAEGTVFAESGTSIFTAASVGSALSAVELFFRRRDVCDTRGRWLGLLRMACSSPLAHASLFECDCG